MEKMQRAKQKASASKYNLCQNFTAENATTEI